MFSKVPGAIRFTLSVIVLASALTGAGAVLGQAENEAGYKPGGISAQKNEEGIRRASPSTFSWKACTRNCTGRVEAMVDKAFFECTLNYRMTSRQYSKCLDYTSRNLIPKSNRELSRCIQECKIASRAAKE